MKQLETYKTKNCNQYVQKKLAVCIPHAALRKKYEVKKDSNAGEPMLFIGGAWGNVSRKFAADIIRQFRKDQAWEGRKNDRKL
jgi:hypothetical protein